MTNELKMKYKKICKKNDYAQTKIKSKKSKGSALATTSYPHLKIDIIHVEILDPRVQIALKRKYDSENDSNKKTKRFNRRCTHCRRCGHKRADCWCYKKEQERYKNDSEKANVSSDTKSEKDIALIKNAPTGSEIALLSTEIRKDAWIADSCASSYMTKHKECTTNVKYHPK